MLHHSGGEPDRAIVQVNSNVGFKYIVLVLGSFLFVVSKYLSRGHLSRGLLTKCECPDFQ